LLDDPGHQALIVFLQGIPARIPTPSAICVISAHWEESTATIASNASPSSRYCHPREEHLLPLHVCAGLSDDVAELVFDGEVLGEKACGFIW
jgi:aromatic ring-opening dioxygenase catalytic subunit (LigB family)